MWTKELTAFFERCWHLALSRSRRYLYFNHMNLAQKSSFMTLPKKIGSPIVSSLAPEYIRYLTDVHMDFQGSPEDSEIILKTRGKRCTVRFDRCLFFFVCVSAIQSGWICPNPAATSPPPPYLQRMKREVCVIGPHALSDTKRVCVCVCVIRVCDTCVYMCACVFCMAILDRRGLVGGGAQV
jgi:hypothetical protein